MTIFEKLRASVITTSADETRALAAEFAALLPADVTLALHGNMGVGKTTFVQGLARGFGILEAVTSPTFNIYTVHRVHAAPGLNQPKISRTLIHLDAYRLESSHEIENLLLEDFLVTPWCLAVEWPEKVADWLPQQRYDLIFDITPDERHSIRLV